MRFCTSLSLFVVMLLTSYPSSAQTFTSNSVDQIVEEYRGDEVPGLAIGIVRDQQVIYERYIGLADLEHQVPVKEETRFNIASNAKQFTALALQTLVEDGKVSLDDDIRMFFPDLYKSVDDPILVRHLLNHSSGIRDVYDLWAISGITWWQEFIGNADAMVLLTRQNDLNFEPGTQFLYSNSNYILLAEIISKVSGKTFSEYTASMFEALGLRDTGFTDNYMDVIPSRARGYGNFGQWVAFPAVTNFSGDGWLYTTLEDQLNYEITLQSKGTKAFDDPLRQSQALVPGSAIDKYGYGLEHSTYRGTHHIYHDGSTGALNASFSRFPEENISIIAISNNGQISTRNITDKITDVVLGETLRTYPKKWDPEALYKRPANSSVVGYYDSNTSRPLFHIVERNGELWREMEGLNPVKLLHQKGNIFYYESKPDWRVVFDKNEDGTKHLTIYFVSSDPLEAVNVDVSSNTLSYKQMFIGAYANPETGAELRIELDSNNALILHALGNQMPLDMKIKDSFRAFGYRFKVKRADNGKADSILLNNDRLRNVRFSRR